MKISVTEEHIDAGIKEALIQIQNDPDSGKVSKYAKYLIKRIERCELAKQAGAELAEQQAELRKALDQIAKDKREKLKKIADLVKLKQKKFDIVYGRGK